MQTASLSLGVISVVLGVIGLFFFFLPIIGIPVSCVAIAAGLIGLILSCGGSIEGLRWGSVGLAVSLLSAGIDIAINHAPSGAVRPYEHPENPSTRDRPFVPPPARWPAP
jgi:Na+/H+ antiporter NhaD/arsenite permease-like protein